MLVLACISPHPPVILPTVGDPADRKKVKKTIRALEKVGDSLAALKPDELKISSPHPDWGFDVPLHFLNSKLQLPEARIQKILTGSEPPEEHYNKGKELGEKMETTARAAWIASGDLSHYLKESGPYGFRPEGPDFDEKLIRLLKRNDVQGLLDLNPTFTERAGECGLRSICLMLGALSKYNYQTEILSYEKPFGVGYLVAKFTISK